eukprot:5620943-Amphidinium_carterae.1
MATPLQRKRASTILVYDRRDQTFRIGEIRKLLEAPSVTEAASSSNCSMISSPSTPHMPPARTNLSRLNRTTV